MAMIWVTEMHRVVREDELCRSRQGVRAMGSTMGMCERRERQYRERRIRDGCWEEGNVTREK